mgnify:FL=1|jgi:hypothetical protein
MWAGIVGDRILRSGSSKGVQRSSLKSKSTQAVECCNEPRSEAERSLEVSDKRLRNDGLGLGYKIALVAVFRRPGRT